MFLFRGLLTALLCWCLPSFFPMEHSPLAPSYTHIRSFDFSGHLLQIVHPYTHYYTPRTHACFALRTSWSVHRYPNCNRTSHWQWLLIYSKSTFLLSCLSLVCRRLCKGLVEVVVRMWHHIANNFYFLHHRSDVWKFRYIVWKTFFPAPSIFFFILLISGESRPSIHIRTFKIEVDLDY